MCSAENLRVYTGGFLAQNRGVPRIRDIDPLRSYYIVKNPLSSTSENISSLIVPCLLSGKKDGSIQIGEIILQRKVYARNAWDQVSYAPILIIRIFVFNEK
jgi:hypothetical protein